MELDSEERSKSCVRFSRKERERGGKGGGEVGARLSPGPRILPSQGPVCIDVDKSRTAINHRLSRRGRGEKKEGKKKGGKFSYHGVYSSHGGSRQFAAVSLSQADNGSLSNAFCSPVERTRYARIRIRGRIHGLFKGFSLSLFLSLSFSSTYTHAQAHRRARHGVARGAFVVANPWSWHSFTAMRRNADASY